MSPQRIVSASIVLTLVSAPVSAQVEPKANAGAVSLSIEEALRRAEAASESVTIARAGVQRSAAQRMQARSEWFPQINGSLTYDRLLESEFEGLFDTPPGGGGEAPGGEGGLGPTLTELPFGRENTWRAGLSLSQNVYAGGRTTARLALSEAAARTAELGLASARAGVVLDAAQAYYDAVLTQRLLTIAEASLQQAEGTLEQIRLGSEQGVRPEFDLLRAHVTVENQRPQVLSARIQRDLALLRLKHLLDLPLDRELVLTSDLEAPQLQDLAPTAQELADAPEPETWDQPRIPVLQALAAVDMRQAGVRIAWSQHLPNVNVVSSYGWVAYPEPLFPDFGEWRNNWTVGLQMQLPIFSGFRITGDVRSAEADLMEARARAQQTSEQASLDTRRAVHDLASARALWEASAGTVAQAERAHQIAELRYREGISTQLELSDARILLQQARANRARTARDLQVARIHVALLPHLPLGAGGAVSGAGVPGGGAATAGSLGGAAPPASMESSSAGQQMQMQSTQPPQGAGGAPF